VIQRKFKKGEPAVLILPAWDERVRMLPVDAQVKIDLPGAQADLDYRAASVKATGEIFYHLGKDKTATTGEIKATWKLVLPVIGSQTISEDPDPVTITIEVEEKYEIADTVPAVPLPYLPSPEEIREGTLKGIPLVDSDGFVYPDDAIQQEIDAAVKWVEEVCSVTFGKADGAAKKVSSVPGAQGFDLIDDPYDFDPVTFQQFGFMQLKRRPVRKVTKLALMFGDQVVFDVPLEWVKVYEESGQINIVPATYAAVPASAYGLLFPSMNGGHLGLTGGKVPALIRIEYEVGLREVPADMRKAIIWRACYSILNTVSDSTTAGLASQSISVDGVSQSLTTTNSSTNSTYGANQLFLQKMLDGWLKTVQSSHRGIVMTVL
jgi:hypothetical protein